MSSLNDWSEEGMLEEISEFLVYIQDNQVRKYLIFEEKLSRKRSKFSDRKRSFSSIFDSMYMGNFETQIYNTATPLVCYRIQLTLSERDLIFQGWVGLSNLRDLSCSDCTVWIVLLKTPGTARIHTFPKYTGKHEEN